MATVVDSTQIYEGSRIPKPIPTVLQTSPEMQATGDILTINFGPNHPSTHGVLRLVVDLKEPAGPYRAGEQTLEPHGPPGLAYTPDFAEMAAVIRKGAEPSYSAQHDLMTQEVLLEACGML